jgi:uncharacterized membrane protein YgdD (TMEM256/DUF423 family)
LGGSENTKIVEIPMNKFDKKITTTASILGILTIAIGAFGAHGLKQLVDAEALASFETGVRYQMYHVIVLLVIGLSSKISEKTKKGVFWFFIIGMILFSGSIYLLALKSELPFSTKFLGPITPVGGLMLMIGWGRLAFGFRSLK